MGAHGNDFPFAEHDDEVCPADLGETVGDDEGGASFSGVGDGALNFVFGR